MSAPYDDMPVPRDDRPAPTVLHDGFVVPGALASELYAALETYAAFLRGTPPPASSRNPRLSRPVIAVMLAAREAAARYEGQRHAARAAWAAPTAPPDKVLGTAQLPAKSDVPELTTAQAADLAGFSPEWWRRLAVRGDIRARQVERRTWLLQREDVVGYATRARQETPHDQHGHQDGPQPRREAS